MGNGVDQDCIHCMLWTDDVFLLSWFYFVTKLLMRTYQNEANKSCSASEGAAKALRADTVLWRNFQQTEAFISFLKWGYLQALNNEKFLKNQHQN